MFISCFCVCGMLISWMCVWKPTVLIQQLKFHLLVISNTFLPPSYLSKRQLLRKKTMTSANFDNHQICLSFFLFTWVNLYVCLAFVFVCLWVCPGNLIVCLCNCVSSQVYLFISLSVYKFSHPWACLWFCLSMSLSVCEFFVSLSCLRFVSGSITQKWPFSDPLPLVSHSVTKRTSP